MNRRDFLSFISKAIGAGVALAVVPNVDLPKPGAKNLIDNPSCELSINGWKGVSDGFVISPKYKEMAPGWFETIDGTLYISGSFGHQSGITPAVLSQWDGCSWQGISSGHHDHSSNYPPAELTNGELTDLMYDELDGDIDTFFSRVAARQAEVLDRKILNYTE